VFLQTNSKTPKRRKVLQDFQRKGEVQKARVDREKCKAIHDCKWMDGGKTFRAVFGSSQIIKEILQLLSAIMTWPA